MPTMWLTDLQSIYVTCPMSAFANTVVEIGVAFCSGGRYGCRLRSKPIDSSNDSLRRLLLDRGSDYVL